MYLLSVFTNIQIALRKTVCSHNCIKVFLSSCDYHCLNEVLYIIIYNLEYVRVYCLSKRLLQPQAVRWPQGRHGTENAVVRPSIRTVSLCLSFLRVLGPDNCPPANRLCRPQTHAQTVHRFPHFLPDGNLVHDFCFSASR